MSKSKDGKARGPVTVCDQLREAIQASGWTNYRIGKCAGIKPEIVTRFVNDERDIRAKTFAKIAFALGLELTAIQKEK